MSREMKFTPGPWRCEDKPDSDCQGQRYAVLGPPHPVDGGDYAPLFRTSNKANGDLAAAAPDLYEALQGFVDYKITNRTGDCEFCGRDVYDIDEPDMHDADCPIEIARAALKKARGEE